MKILILQDEFYPEAKGGAAVVAFELAKSFLNHGHRVSVISITQNRDLEAKSSLEGLEIYRIFSSYPERWRAYVSLYNRRTVKQIKQIITDIMPDVVHAHIVHLHLSYHALKLAKKSGAKVFLTAHDAMLYDYSKVKNNLKVSWIRQLVENRLRFNPFRNLIIRYYLKFVDKIIAVSDSLKDALENNKVNNVAVIHNGIDVKSWEASEEKVERFREKFGLVGKKVIFFGGRLSGAKGGEQIILAMAKVIKNFPEAILLIAGRKNSYAEKMLELSINLGIDKNIIFTGWLDQEDLKLAYMASNIIVLPSVYPEPFGMIAIEAMACKKPVIGTCFGGTREIVQDKISGFIVSPLDINQFASKIIEIINNPDLGKRMGEAGYKRVKVFFDLNIQVEKYLKLFMAS